MAAKVIVVGGGIGGLTAALALGRTGVEAAVFERAPELREIGAGISLWANATRALKGLGVYEEVRDAGAADIGGELRSWRGEMISEIPADELRTRFGEANLAVHRADLQGALLAALPEGTVRLIEDAAVLARCLGGGGEVPCSLRLYEARRVRRTAGIVKRSRLVGRLVQLESPPLCRLRDAVARRISARAQLRQYEEIARYEA